MGQATAVVEREVQLRASDGAELPMFIAEPAGAPGAPRMVIAPEIFARDSEPIGTQMQSWMARMQRLDILQAVRDLRLALDHLQGGPAGLIGFCPKPNLAGRRPRRPRRARRPRPSR